MKRIMLLVLLVAMVFVFLDYLFHLFLTYPMELPEYFVMKFLIAMFSAYILIKYLKKLTYIRIAIGSVLHSTIASAYYYAITIYGYKTIFPIIFGFSYNYLINDLMGWLAHFVIFFIAVIIALKLTKTKIGR